MIYFGQSENSNLYLLFTFLFPLYNQNLSYLSISLVNNNDISFQGLAKSVCLENLSLANCPIADEGLEGMYIHSIIYLNR